MKILLNENFNKLESNYLFSEIARRVQIFKEKNPSTRVISLGIGDVSLPISRFVANEMSSTALQLATKDGFVGYGDTLGLKSLRTAISNRYKSKNINISWDEIFISDGAKSDLGNIFDILGDNEIAIFDPVYPVYLDSSIISGRKILLINATEDNGFLPSPEGLPNRPFVIFLCSPNNPTGAVFSRKMLEKWVFFALSSGSLIIFDAAYEEFIQDNSLPKSIFEIEGARECAIEICSFSKSAGFTGIRCGWTAIPKDSALHALWKRRQSTKFNGASYISQRGALAYLSQKGYEESVKNIEQYMNNAKKIASFLKKKQIFFVGGENAPYLWFKIPFKASSWDFFDLLLNETGVVGTPGVGFGRQGEGFFRFSSFAKSDDVDEALERLDIFL